MRIYDTVPVRQIPYSAAPSAEAAHYAGLGRAGMARDPRAELNRMKRSLKGWLRFRDLNTAAGLTPTEAAERGQIETTLAAKMKALLMQVYGDGVLLPNDAPSLARLILSGQAPAASAPQATGILPMLVIVGAIALVLMSGISSWADYAKEKERYECIEKYGAWQCDTTGQLWKWGLIAGGAWLAWTKFGLRDLVGRFRGRGK
jgi:hypothetical protein